MLVLPVEHTFLYVEPIYIQATEARMPQLRKIVLAIGNRLIYTDTYDQARAELNGTNPTAAAALPATLEQTPSSTSPVPQGDTRITSIREHFRRYQSLTSQGKLAEAGRELEAINQELQ